MPTYIAPGVYSEEIDLSLYVPQLSTCILGLVGGFQKGPTDTITLITTPTQFEQVFGTPMRGDVGHAAHAALYFLRWGNQLKVVRVVDGNEAYASDTLSRAVGGTSMGLIQGVTHGDWAAGIQVVITAIEVPSEADPAVQETVYSVYVYAPGTAKLDSAGRNASLAAPLEVWEDVVFNDVTSTKFVEKMINGRSLYIAFALTAEANPATDQIYTLAGGNDGTTDLGPPDIIGSYNPQTGISTGIRAFEDPLVEDINLLSAPGFNHDRTVANFLIVTAQTRFDCLAVLDTPNENTAQELSDYIQGSEGTPGNFWASYAPLASSNRSAIYGPWVKIYDAYNNEEIFVPPTVRLLGAFAYNDSVAYPWFATAGPNRGLLLDTLDVRFRLTLGEVEATYGFGVNLNPVQVTVDGILINGNKTLQRRPSLLQNVHIVRMFMYAEKVIATAARYLQWEPHDPITWRRYVNLVEPFLRDIVTKRGITDFRVKCDKDTNSSLDINQGQLIAELHIIPTTAVAVIVNRYIVHAHGTELASQTVITA